MRHFSLCQTAIHFWAPGKARRESQLEVGGKMEPLLLLPQAFWLGVCKHLATTLPHTGSGGRCADLPNYQGATASTFRYLHDFLSVGASVVALQAHPKTLPSTTRALGATSQRQKEKGQHGNPFLALTLLPLPPGATTERRASSGRPDEQV